MFTYTSLTNQLRNRTDLGKCTHLCDETQRNIEPQALSTEDCLLQVQKDREIIIKKEDRQEGADAKKIG